MKRYLLVLLLGLVAVPLRAGDETVRLGASPRFVDGTEKVRFVAEFMPDSPLYRAGPVTLHIRGEDEAGEVWFDQASRAVDVGATRQKTLSLTAPLKQPPTWTRLRVEGRIRAGEDVLAACATTLYHEGNLLQREDRLRAKAATMPRARCPLAWLSFEQLALLRRDRERRTRLYGEAASYFLERAARVVDARLKGNDPLRNARGILEGAYVSEIDESIQPYRFFVPQRLDELTAGGKTVPLVVLLHGYVPSYDKLDWVNITEEMAAAFERLGCILLLPFGRSNTDFLSVGEVDVLRAIEETRARYPVDPARVYLAGYSMGGSGVWTLLAHYPDRFAAAQVWSGRTDYYFWHEEAIAGAGLSRQTYPFYKRVLIETDNPYDLAATLRDIPIIAAHPRDDTLVKPGHTRRIYELLQEPRGRMRLINARTGHGHWYFAEQLDKAESYRWMLSHKVDEAPETVEHIAYMPKYGRKQWVNIRLLETWGEPAHVTVRAVPAEKKLVIERCENVAAAEFSPPFVVPEEEAAPWVIVDADGKPLPEDRWTFAHFGDDKTTMTLKKLPAVTPAKTSALCGPVKEAFNQPFALVVGTAGDLPARHRNRRNAERFLREWEEFARGTPPLLTDVQALEAEVPAKNYVLFGSPKTNRYLARIAQRLPFRFYGDGYGVGEKQARGKGLGFVGIYPHPGGGRYVVVVDGLYYGQELPFNHKWDLVPDYIVFGPLADGYDGTNTALLAGFFDSWWRVDPALAYEAKLPRVELPAKETGGPPDAPAP